MEKPTMVGNHISQWSERYFWSRPSTRTSLCTDNSICLRRCKTQRTVIMKLNSIRDLLKYWRLAGTSSTVLSGRGRTQRYVTGWAWTPLHHTFMEVVSTLSLQYEYIFFHNPISWCSSFINCRSIPLLLSEIKPETDISLHSRAKPPVLTFDLRDSKKRHDIWVENLS